MRAILIIATIFLTSLTACAGGAKQPTATDTEAPKAAVSDIYVANPDEMETPLMISNLGHYATVEQLKASPIYPVLAKAHPQLAQISEVTIDRGSGNMWLLVPCREGMSLAVNEYNIDIFNGDIAENDAPVLYRSEEPMPMIIRAPMDAPGSIRIIAVAGKVTVDCVPQFNPADNELRMINITEVSYLSQPLRLHYGSEYSAGSMQCIFYQDRQVRVNGVLMNFFAYKSVDGENILYFYNDEGKDFWGTFDEQPPGKPNFNFSIKGSKNENFKQGDKLRMTLPE